MLDVRQPIVVVRQPIVVKFVATIGNGFQKVIGSQL